MGDRFPARFPAFFPRGLGALPTAFVALLAGLLPLSALAAEDSGPPAPGRYTVTRATSPIQIDGVLDEAAWRDALVIPLRYEWHPGDNTPPPVETLAYITFDEEHVYFAFEAFDPDPSSIRANLMDRDSIETFVQDDHVGVMIDTFDDQRRAFQFRVNPLGVQADAIFSQVEFVEDFSWDIIWASAGRVTEQGYVVEIAIPVSQLRFPVTEGPQTWGIELSRSWPRSNRHRISANPRDRGSTCLLCQLAKVTGFEGLQPGRNLEVVPTVTVDRTDRRTPFPGGGLEAGSERIEPGITASWGITPALTLNATINPDFSQVEADVAQLEVNERFALFFPEKRPFFLEGVDFFRTPLNAVFTRTVVSPDWGLKLTGKQGRHAGGLFLTQDEVNSLVIPSNQGSAFAFLDQGVTAGVMRYRHDLGEASTVGLLYAGREGSDYHNRVAGVDGFFRLSPRDEVRVQYLASDTRYPLELAQAFGQRDEGFTGSALRVTYSHNQRNWFASMRYDDLAPGFRADSGFIPRVDLRMARVVAGRLFWPEEGARWSRAESALAVSRTEDHAGRLTDEFVSLWGNIGGPRQSWFNLGLSRRSERVVDTLHEDMWRLDAYAEAQPVPWAKVAVYTELGETVDYANNRRADYLLAVPRVELKVGRHLNAQVRHSLLRLDAEEGRVSQAALSQLRLVYNFSVRSFLRAILQYSEVDRDPDLFTFPVSEREERLFTQLLFSYKLNPQTVLFLGYSDNHLGATHLSLTQANRTFFFKVGYAWIL